MRWFWVALGVVMVIGALGSALIGDWWQASRSGALATVDFYVASLLTERERLRALVGGAR